MKQFCFYYFVYYFTTLFGLYNYQYLTDLNIPLDMTCYINTSLYYNYNIIK